jgi:L-aminopeptidase/D-esterase-like protein
MSSITDVPGFRVGQVERVGDGWLTGVTVVVPPRGTVAQAVIRGSAPASHQVASLHPGATSPTPQAIVLTGGSSYGLIAAHGAARRFVESGLGYAAGPGAHDVIPLVPASAIYDVGRGGDFRAVPTEQMGYDAAAQAIASTDFADVRRGSVGAGTGAALFDERYKGGVGTASVTITLAGGVTVRFGALAVVNAFGSPLDAHGDPASLPDGERHPGYPAAGNTTLVVLATDARLDLGTLLQTASTAHDGLARTIDPVHTLADGDAVFALASGDVEIPGEPDRFRQPRVWRDQIIGLQAAAARVTADAIRDGIRHGALTVTPAFTFRPFPGA